VRDKPVICLMGPTASGKTEVALRLADTFAADLISVDSALVYRHMNIGTAKPDSDTLRDYPHALVDIRDPEEAYSAGEFVRDATAAIAAAHERSRLPLLVGGTMMYFRALTEGIAELPDANPAVRQAIDDEAARSGWPALHARLAGIDPDAAMKINANDSQRIQRALEVYELSGRTLTAWQAATNAAPGFSCIKLALIPEPRAALHARIEARLDRMIAAGFVDEMHALRQREGLTAGHPSMRSVGYRQFWPVIDGEIEPEAARDKALAATRQLAKRQLTWLRSERDLFAVNPLEVDAFATISDYLRSRRER
jgi:tRNA dimethylallyltransferase